MSARANLLVTSTVLTLLCSLAATEVAAQAITVAPADPVIFVGQPQQFTVIGIDTATAIEAGTFHQCALLQDTTVRCWGENDYGQLGRGTISSPPETPNPTPVAVNIGGWKVQYRSAGGTSYGTSIATITAKRSALHRLVTRRAGDSGSSSRAADSSAFSRTTSVCSRN